MLLSIVACGNGQPAHPDSHADASHAGADASHAGADAALAADAAHALTYAVTQVPTSCDTLGSPTVLPLLGLIHATDVYALPAPWPFFDTTRTRFSVAEQGQLLLFDSTHADITTLVDPAQIPSVDPPNGFVAPLWTFAVLFVPQRSVINAQVVGRHTTVEWNDFAIGAGVPELTSHLTFQVKLFDDGAIELHYCQLDPGRTTATHDEAGARASVGIESPDGTKGVSVGFWQDGTTTTAHGYRFSPS